MGRHDSLTKEFLQDLFDYDQKTGKLYWKKRLSQRAKIGSQAGYMRLGYVCIGIENTHYSAHRIVWIMHYGYNPKLDIDHINGDRSDNRLENLREISRRKNTQNKKCHREGKVVGVCYRPNNKHNKYQAQIQMDGRRIYLGCYPTEKLASQAYWLAVQKIGRTDET